MDAEPRMYMTMTDDMYECFKQAMVLALLATVAAFHSIFSTLLSAFSCCLW